MGLLQQIVESSDTAEGEEITYVSSAENISSKTQVASGQMVGATAAELESLKELIQFDHEYYKAGSPEPAQEQQDEVIEIIVSSSPSDDSTPASPSQPQAMESILPVEVMSVTSTVDELMTDITEATNSCETADDPATVDLATYLSSVESIMDLEALLGLSQYEEDSADRAVSSDSEDLPACKRIKLEPQEFSNKADTWDCIPKVTDLPEDFSSLFDTGDADSGFLLSPDPLNPHSSTLSSSGDSCYQSDISEIGSPKHEDCSFYKEDKSFWEESFTELFPSLA